MTALSFLYLCISECRPLSAKPRAPERAHWIAVGGKILSIACRELSCVSSWHSGCLVALRAADEREMREIRVSALGVLCSYVGCGAGPGRVRPGSSLSVSRPGLHSPPTGTGSARARENEIEARV